MLARLSQLLLLVFSLAASAYGVSVDATSLTPEQDGIIQAQATDYQPNTLGIDASVNQTNEAETAKDEPKTKEDQAEILRLTRELEVRQRAIEDIESEQGIYSPALVEAYADLANLHEQLQDHNAAIDVYTNALHVARISNGLNSTEQLPVVQKLIDSNSQLQAWQEVDDLQYLSYHVSSRAFGFSSLDHISAVNRFGRWKLRLLRENLLSQSGSGLLDTASELDTFYTRNIALLEQTGIEKSEPLMELYYGNVLTHVELARAVARTPFEYFQGYEKPYITQTRCRAVRNANGETVRQCTNHNVPNPRYRDSQRREKNAQLRRYSAEASQSVARLVDTAQAVDLSESERVELETKIRQVEVELQAMSRYSGRSGLNDYPGIRF